MLGEFSPEQAITVLNTAYQEYIQLTRQKLDEFDTIQSAASRLGKMLLDLNDHHIVYHFDNIHEVYKLGVKPLVVKRVEWYD